MRYAENLLAEFDNEMDHAHDARAGDVWSGRDKARRHIAHATRAGAHIANIVRFGDFAIGADERGFSAAGAAMPATCDTA